MKQTDEHVIGKKQIKVIEDLLALVRAHRVELETSVEPAVEEREGEGLLTHEFEEGMKWVVLPNSKVWCECEFVSVIHFGVSNKGSKCARVQGVFGGISGWPPFEIHEFQVRVGELVAHVDEHSPFRVRRNDAEGALDVWIPGLKDNRPRLVRVERSIQLVVDDRGRSVHQRPRVGSQDRRDVAVKVPVQPSFHC
jgi:hypothetical protein